MILYALHDWDTSLKQKFGAFPIAKDKAESLNLEGYGIHFTPNDFNGSRKKENITKINWWFADLDAGTKEEQMTKIDKLLMKPSMIVESKRGYHLYWKSVDASVDNFRKIMEGISKKIGSDEAIKDPARMMRAPGYFHMKDKDNPFKVRIVFQGQDTFTEKEMIYAFGYKKPVKKHVYEFNRTKNKSEMLDPANWNKIFFLDRLTDGNRNNEFARIVLWLKDTGFDGLTIKETVSEMNRRIISPLNDGELYSIMKGKI